MSKKYALVIGNSDYDDPNWHDLKTPGRDAEAMAAVLADPKIGGFDRVTPLLSASVTKIRREIFRLFAPTSHQPDDLLLLYFSGHGELDSNDRLYFIGRETEHAMVEATGLDADYITRLMDRARSRRQVIILDSCYSGTFGKLPKGGVPTEEIFKGNSEAVFEQAKAVLENSLNGYGRHILAATEALQLAWEGDTLQGEVENSFFTQFLVEGLTKGLADRNNDGLIDIEELYDHIREGMRTSKQTPIKRSLYANGKLIIARSPISSFERKQEQLTDLLAQAEQAMSRGDYSRAERLLSTVIKAETDELLVDIAQATLDDLKAERARARAYSHVKSLVKKKAARTARLAWQRFAGKYPDYDPDNLAEQVAGASSLRRRTQTQEEQPVEAGGDSTPSPSAALRTGQPPPARERSESDRRWAERVSAEEILPSPFAWIEIPGKDYNIAKYPLTNAQFAPFVEAGGYTEKKWWTEAGWEKRQAENWERRYWQKQNKGWNRWNGAEQPVVGVSWYEAVAYCLWISEKTGQKIMLPTEEQWRYAAQGDDGRTYPWGNEWDCKRCNNSVKPCDSNVTTPVTCYEGKGDSPFGVVDMAGNVWEWCLTEFESGSNDLDGTNVRVLRGGSWDGDDTGYFRVSYRNWIDPNYGVGNRGFRLALSL